MLSALYPTPLRTDSRFPHQNITYFALLTSPLHVVGVRLGLQRAMSHNPCIQTVNYSIAGPDSGLALGVASLGLQVYTGCIQGIQLLITALGYDDECKYLNLRLRMEQQRLFAWSETSGLLDVGDEQHDKILNSNIFNLHRQTVLDMLVQIRCLFDEFTSHQRRHNNLKTARDEDDLLGVPDEDARLANFPISDRKQDFIKKAMTALKEKSQQGYQRLRWVSFDKVAFELVLSKFSALNDNMTNILDHSLQVEIRHTVEDTNRGVLLLHRKIADLSHLVLALKSQLDAGAGSLLTHSPLSKLEREASLDSLVQLSKLAKFKAFSETLDPKTGRPCPVDKTAAGFLELANPSQPSNVQLPRYLIELGPDVDQSDTAPCEALMKTAAGKKRVWIEWKNYDTAGLHPDSLSKEDIISRVRKLASLLNHRLKPKAFRTPHCLGFFDKADPDIPADDVDILERRLGLIFERPCHDSLHATLPPVSLHSLLQDDGVRKPRVTERVQLATALSNCVLYLHAVNWLHKGLRSHNVIFFRTRTGKVDYCQPYLSGFDCSRPGGSDEMTDVPGDDAEHDLYRHPDTQTNRGRERQRSKKCFDIYSLGIIFVELAHWKTVDKVLGIDMQRARGKPDVLRKVQGELLGGERMADVGGEMGEKFEYVVRTCLGGEEKLRLYQGQKDGAEGAAEKLSTRFYEEVVKKLGQVVV
ncbi:Protein kinase-like domain protein [Metarhizium album ARSEF 1941]|uniref:Protein kinase-like domain protein n=1 Tax=Metarhizium album (strain ARSEF 1941) TaxID=1081103 RepID=A0A0B2WWQ9_METAS|nr:Protein kinase-like domain protein [Metarhizium album ARSEF 1941]KHO00657.1 Protein kinase-like domain protein [Metarhizium album ARSEF 1941]